MSDLRSRLLFYTRTWLVSNNAQSSMACCRSCSGELLASKSNLPMVTLAEMPTPLNAVSSGRPRTFQDLGKRGRCRDFIGS